LEQKEEEEDRRWRKRRRRGGGGGYGGGEGGGRRWCGATDLFSCTTVEQNGLKLWGSGAFFLPPQGMYYPV